MSNPEAINYSRAGQTKEKKERSPPVCSNNHVTSGSDKESASPSPSPGKSPLVPIKEATPTSKEATPVSTTTDEDARESSGELSPGSPNKSPSKKPRSKSFLRGLFSRSKSEKSRERSQSFDLDKSTSPDSEDKEVEEEDREAHRVIHQQKPSSSPNSPEMVVRLEHQNDSQEGSSSDGKNKT